MVFLRAFIVVAVVAPDPTERSLGRERFLVAKSYWVATPPEADGATG